MGSWTKPIERDHLRASIDYQQKVISNSAKTNQINSVSVCPILSPHLPPVLSLLL